MGTDLGRNDLVSPIDGSLKARSQGLGLVVNDDAWDVLEQQSRHLPKPGG